MIPFRSLVFFIISLLLFIIPIIICYKFFSKGEKGSLTKSMYLVTLLTIIPSSTSGAPVTMTSESARNFLLFIGLVVGVVFAVINICEIKKNIQYHDHFIVNYACGAFIAYTFYIYVIIGIIIWILTDKNGELKIFDVVFSNWLLFYISVYIFICFLGVCCSLVFEFIFYKYHKMQFLIALAFIFQISVYCFNVFIIFGAKNIIYVNLIISIICIGLSIFAWYNYSKDEENTINNSINELITNS